jgi:ABC-type nitrate/sulfonate/bicarbonate transport system substrate-binding protein
MLYHPWRDEDTLKECDQSYAQRYTQIKEEIENFRTLYELFAEAVIAAQQYLLENEDQEGAWDQLAAQNQQTSEEDRLDAIQPPDAGIEDPDIGQALGLAVSSIEELHNYNEMDDEEHRSYIHKLTTDQIQFVYDTIHQIKTSEEPIYRFLSGRAGVGKMSQKPYTKQHINS